MADDAENAILDGIFALITPVMTFTDGRCVANTKWIPAARANWASLHTASSTSLEATIIRSANSSTMITNDGILEYPAFSGSSTVLIFWL